MNATIETTVQAEGARVSDKPRVFIIPASNMGPFNEKFDKLVRRAHRLNVTLPTYTVASKSTKTYRRVVGREKDESGAWHEVVEENVVQLDHIVISSGMVVVKGHEFCATIEHTPEGNVIRSLEGKKVPTSYRECKSYCDHCRTMRRRNDTFILRHVENNTYMQVGRNCLADFLGWDAERYAGLAEIYFELDELATASEDGGDRGFGGGMMVDHLERFLSYVAEVILLCGWKSRAMARDFGGASTAQIADNHLHPTADWIREGNRLFRTPSDKSVKQAQDAIAWCESLSDAVVEPSDYLHNIRLIARRGLVTPRQQGYAASIVSGYMRHVGELKAREQRALQPESKWVNSVGERSKFILTVDKIISSDSQWGTSHLHLMTDRQGNKFTWGSSSHKLEEGTEYLLKGTVKAHTEYMGRDGNQKPVKQTKLTRCEALEMKEYSCKIGEVQYTIPAESEKEARKMLLETLKLTKLPRGSTFAEVVKVVVAENVLEVQV